MTSLAGEMIGGGKEVCHTICSTDDRGCNAQHSFAEGGVNLLGAYNDDSEDENCLREEHMCGSQWRRAAHQTMKLAEPSRNLIRGHIQAVSSFSLCQAFAVMPTCTTRQFVVLKNGELDVIGRWSGDGHPQRDIRQQRTAKVAARLQLFVTQDGRGLEGLTHRQEDGSLHSELASRCGGAVGRAVGVVTACSHTTNPWCSQPAWQTRIAKEDRCKQRNMLRRDGKQQGCLPPAASLKPSGAEGEWSWPKANLVMKAR
ncbi:MAG: hypothetical protein FRX49_05704 [Trebouxia sp. A1-2]|nr:MAG: hypothetical protein FRX49_05704 [Trebouxia sp. A1-2]